MRRISRALSVIAAAVAIMVATVTTPASGDEPPLEVGPPSVMSETPTGRIDVMGIWSAPDTAATMTAQCGVWQDLYGVGCGIIALSRGEEPLNEAGEESGAALALRRENEARAAS